MLTYRTRIMLYSSVLALCFLDVSKVFATPEDSAIKSSKSDTVTSSALEGAPPSLGAKEALRKTIKEEEEFLKRTEEVTNKYSNGLQYVLGKEVDVRAITRENNALITEDLLKFNTNGKEEVRDLSDKINKKQENSKKDKKTYTLVSLKEKLKDKMALIKSKKQSVLDEYEWLEKVNKSAEIDLAHLKELKNEIEQLKAGNPKLNDKLDSYRDTIRSFLVSYQIIVVCTAFLKKSEAYCQNKEISNKYIKKFFPHFTDARFEASFNTIDMVAGDERRAMTTAYDSHSFYPIDEQHVDEHQLKEYLGADAPSDSDDIRLFNLIKNKLKSKGKENETAKDLLKHDNGGIIFSYNVMYRDGMAAPLCVFTAVSCTASPEGEIKEYTLRRFSIVDKNEKVDLTKQFINAENKESRAKVEEANAELQDEISEIIKSEHLAKEKAAEEKLKAAAEGKKEKEKEKHSDASKDGAKKTNVDSDSHPSDSKLDEHKDEHKAEVKSKETTSATGHAKEDVITEKTEKSKSSSETATKSAGAASQKTEVAAEKIDDKKEKSGFFGSLFGGSSEKTTEKQTEKQTDKKAAA